MIDSVRELQQSGMSRKQAEALIKLMRAMIAEAVQPLATKAELAALKASHDAQIALLRSDLIEKMSANLKYTAFSVGFSTVAIITALFAAFFGVPTGG